jgi:hypothetical protein
LSSRQVRVIRNFVSKFKKKEKKKIKQKMPEQPIM